MADKGKTGNKVGHLLMDFTRDAESKALGARIEAFRVALEKQTGTRIRFAHAAKALIERGLRK